MPVYHDFQYLSKQSLEQIEIHIERNVERKKLSRMPTVVVCPVYAFQLKKQINVIFIRKL